MRKTKQRKKFKVTKRQAVLLLLSVCFIAGLWFGGIAAYTMEGKSYGAISQTLSEYLGSFNHLGANPMDIFRESLVKYGKLFVFLWVLAFLPMPVGAFAATILIVFRGTSYGFATAALIRNYGSAGSACAAILYLPQSLFLIPAYIFTAYSCVQFVTQNSGKAAKKTGLREYALVLAAGLAASVLAGFIDAFIVPELVKNLL